MILSKLTKLEKDFMQLFFELCPQWKQTINKQIQQSNIQRKHSISNYSVCFVNSIKTDKLGISTKMPVEIILGRVDIPADSIVKRVGGCSIISPGIISILDDDPIGVRIYFSDGLLTELEIYSISGKELVKTMDLEKQRTYIVFDMGAIE